MPDQAKCSINGSCCRCSVEVTGILTLGPLCDTHLSGGGSRFLVDNSGREHQGRTLQI